MKRFFFFAVVVAASFSTVVRAGEMRSLQGFELPEVQGPAAGPAAALPGELSEGKGLVHAPNPAQARATRLRNESLGKSVQKSGERMEVKYRPYADHEKTGYLIMSAAFEFNSIQGKREMAKALPADATLVIFWDNPTPRLKEEILAAYDGAISRDRIKIISLPGSGGGFWARDAIPVPMFDKAGKFTVIDAEYYHGFAADKEVARIFNAGYEKHDYGFEGGNFQANTKGDCMIVDNDRHAKIPDSAFAGFYGCKQVIRLPHVAGIGHVDEVARFINDTTIVTDIPEYKETLAAKGFEVHMLPRPAKPFETYVNSLIMDGKVVVPVFNEATDAEALAVYEKLGLKATGGDSTTLSNKGLGSLHCITMTYPPVPMAELMKSLGAREI